MSRRHRPRRVGPLHRLAGLARALGALTASGVLLIAAPAVMWRLVGWPLPDRVPAWDDVVAGLTGPLTQDLILGLIGALFWYTYALLVLSVAVEVVATAGGWTRPRLPTAGPAQALAAVLVGTVLAGLLTATARASTGPPTAAVLTAYARPAAVTAPADPTADAARPPAAANAMVPAGLECTVAPYDTLWSLAEDWLHGDGLRWREIWTLNQGRVQADGTALTNPDLLRPGWILRLPPDAQPPTPPMAPEGPDTTAAPHASGPATPPTTTPAPLPPTAPGTAAPAAPAAPGTFSPAPSAPGWTPTIPRTRPPPLPARPHTPARPHAPTRPHRTRPHRVRTGRSDCPRARPSRSASSPHSPPPWSPPGSCAPAAAVSRPHPASPSRPTRPYPWSSARSCAPAAHPPTTPTTPTTATETTTGRVRRTPNPAATPTPYRHPNGTTRRNGYPPARRRRPAQPTRFPAPPRRGTWTGLSRSWCAPDGSTCTAPAHPPLPARCWCTSSPPTTATTRPGPPG
ncbi:LysM peptidoglycan-binding domain-containing protein [Parafrankia sp. CH37]|uniref:LysM peptidoglycan-binding domain-containing protein n=1 Tax=Parafrankia sp. CH37 TaxID=683308 RepID=UPI001866EFFD|nr:LysM peptidoglycan-binding domain-containing protein [Parafrankia sp. CH37]MBE3204730.1 LysM peptidoglycan-binding domain-containing protein [Parafrankia sp. CH37]